MQIYANETVELTGWHIDTTFILSCFSYGLISLVFVGLLRKEKQGFDAVLFGMEIGNVVLCVCRLEMTGRR